MNELLVKRNGVTLCTESFGQPDKPVILLMMGATASMLWWDEQFCRQLAQRGYFVIRYDNRDVGKSTTYSPGVPPYDLEDMVEDAISILDAYEVKQAHLFGMSLGGLLGQIAALTYPDRVLSLILLGTGAFGPADPAIPEMDERIITFQAGAAQLDWSDEKAVVAYLVGGAKLLSGPERPYDEQRFEALTKAEFRRATTFQSMYNHAQLQGGDAFFGKVNQILQPALIIHGTADKIWPYAHALHLQKELPNANLLPLDGAGHELHQLDWNSIITAVDAHIAPIQKRS